MAKHVNKGIPLAKSPQASKVEKGKKILDQVKEFKVPTNVKIRVHKTVTPDGATFPIIHADVKTKAVKDLGIVKMVGSGSSGSTPTRLIPGTPGKVTGGSSTKLGKNMFEQMGLPRSTKRTPYQAQHIIPKEFRSHPVLKKLGMDMDDASNGFFLRVPEDDISATSRHKGYHSVYSSFVRKKLDEIDVNQSVDAIEKQVYGLQQKLRELQEKGLPLYMRDDYLQTELKKIKEKGFEAYKLERKEDSASRKPVWKRGGGATVDLWERWYNK
ncbi:AHH domain-containing protein [Bacillus velezensis]|uniref:AHH domain-containing protein n=1 Tax=Bacillus velezensis TaxID=492670 RepID=UPI0039F68D27